jgi:hypothetical protein
VFLCAFVYIYIGLACDIFLYMQQLFFLHINAVYYRSWSVRKIHLSDQYKNIKTEKNGGFFAENYERSYGDIMPVQWEINMLHVHVLPVNREPNSTATAQTKRVGRVGSSIWSILSTG